MTRVAIVGVGLIGSSLALALRERRAATELWGMDLAGVEGAAGAFDRRVDRAELARADVVVLSTPVSVIVRELPHALSAPVVTDTGSTKRVIAAEGAAHFVPGHPMAGDPQGGAERARADLFEGRRWILCPEGRDPAAVAQVEALVRAVGAEVVQLGAEEHDRAVAVTSHLPQLLASLLKGMSLQRGTDAAAGPAFEGATRVAGGPEAMWRDVFVTNADAIAAAGRDLASQLDGALAALEKSPPDVEPALALLARVRRVVR